LIKYGLLTADDEWASEYEVYDFLYALVRLLKPKVILETGCYKGGATFQMAKAADVNLVALWTCDTSEQMIDEARRKIPRAWLASEIVRLELMNGCDLCAMVKDVDLAFIDSSGDRVAEVQALNLAPNGVVVLHDAKRPQYQAIKTLRPWKAIWEIDTVQGITVFQS